MPLTVDRYRVLLTDADPAVMPSEHVVSVIHGDRVRAELEAGKRGIPAMQTAPMTFLGLWLWAACLREKVLADVTYDDFQDRLLNFEEVADEPQFPGSPVTPDAMGPTTEAATASPSSSPVSSVPSSSGSTPAQTDA